MKQPDPKFFIGEPVIIHCPSNPDAAVAVFHGKRTHVTAIDYCQEHQTWCYQTALMPADHPGGCWAEHALRPVPGDEPAQWNAGLFQPRKEGGRPVAVALAVDHGGRT